MPAKEIAGLLVKLHDASAAGDAVHYARAQEVGPAAAEPARHADDGHRLLHVLPFAAADAAAVREDDTLGLGPQCDSVDSPPHKQNMNRTFLKFDPYEALENLRATPAKVAKVRPASPQGETNSSDRGSVRDPDPAGSPVEMALTIIHHLRGYALPAGRMPAARAIAARLRPLLTSADLDLADAVR